MQKKEEKLLIMGVDSATRYIIKEAQKKKLYTILTDYLPMEKSPLKGLVDEAWFVDVGALDELEKKCRESGVTAVMAGNHEYCLDCTKELAKRLELPFYASDTCWRYDRDKALFKQLCADSGLPVAKNYSIDGPVEFPVCVKPSDSSSQRGVSFIYEEKDLQPAYERALSFSENKKVIIEQLLTGQEVMLVGYADQGNYHILFVTEPLSVLCGGKPCISIGCHSYSKAAELLGTYGERIYTMLRKMDHQNGLFMLQGFVEADGTLYLFESGIRFDGGACAYLSSKVNNIDPVGWMIDLARGIKPEIDWSNIDATKENKPHTSYLIYCRPGTIARIEGVEEVESLPGVEFLLKRYKPGDVVVDVGNMTQVGFYLHLVADTPEEMIALLKKLNSTLRIMDDKGNSLLIYADDYDQFLEYMTK